MPVKATGMRMSVLLLCCAVVSLPAHAICDGHALVTACALVLSSAGAMMALAVRSATARARLIASGSPIVRCVVVAVLARG